MDGRSEEKRSKRVSLLYPSGGLYSRAPKLKSGRLLVAPGNPARQAREMRSRALQNLVTGDAVEGVDKIKLQEDFARDGSLPLYPSPHRVDPDLSAALYADTKLGRPQDAAGIFLYQLHQAFRGESPEDFTRYGANPSSGFRHSNKPGASQNWGDQRASLALRHQIHKLG